MTYSRRSLRLYLGQRDVLWAPLFALSVMVLLSVLIAIVIGVSTGLPLQPHIAEGFGSNAGAVWCLPGFLISAGAVAVNRNFAMAMAFGSTRRHFWLGTALGFTVTSLVSGAAAVLLLAVEMVTNHWWVGARALDVVPLGRGNPVQTFLVMTCLALLSTFLGAFFGTIYRLHGPAWLATSLVVGAVVVFAVVAAVVWQWGRVGPWFVAAGLWSAILVGALVAALAAAGSYAMSQRATL